MSEWHETKKELPGADIPVVGCTSDGVYEVFTFTLYGYFRHISGHQYAINKIIYWMYIPDLPR